MLAYQPLVMLFSKDTYEALSDVVNIFIMVRKRSTLKAHHIRHYEENKSCHLSFLLFMVELLYHVTEVVNRSKISY